MIALRHSDDAVICEFYLLGTHLGPLGPVPPTGGTFKVRMNVYFVFDENEQLMTERIYFDQLTLLSWVRWHLSPRHRPLLRPFTQEIAGSNPAGGIGGRSQPSTAPG